jgi:hypothetical protein
MVCSLCLCLVAFGLLGKSVQITVDQKIIFKLGENTALLLHFIKIVAETTVFDSVSDLRCWLVVGIPQVLQF